MSDLLWSKITMKALKRALLSCLYKNEPSTRRESNAGYSTRENEIKMNNQMPYSWLVKYNQMAPSIQMFGCFLACQQQGHRQVQCHLSGLVANIGIRIVQWCFWQEEDPWKRKETTQEVNSKISWMHHHQLAIELDLTIRGSHSYYYDYHPSQRLSSLVHAATWIPETDARLVIYGTKLPIRMKDKLAEFLIIIVASIISRMDLWRKKKKKARRC